MKTNFTRFVPISKTDDEKKMVYGYASTPSLDSQGEVVELSAIERALPEYLKFPTIREMHQPKAVGTTKQTKIDNKGLFIGAKVVDKEAWEKVKEGVFRGFSIGGRIKNMIGNTIKDLDLSEISLVDRPANAEAVITVYKRDTSNDLPEWQQAHLKVINKKHSLSTKEEIERVQKIMEVLMAKKDKKVKPENEVKPEETKVDEKEVKEEKPTEEVKEEKTEEVTEDVQESEKEKVATIDRLEKLEKALDEKVKKEANAEVAKVDALSKGLEKVASVLEKLVERVDKLEAQPAPTKTKAFIAEKTFDTVDNKVDPDKQARLTKIQGRLDELMSIREATPGQYTQELQDEAYRLMGEKRAMNA